MGNLNFDLACVFHLTIDLYWRSYLVGTFFIEGKVGNCYLDTVDNFDNLDNLDTLDNLHTFETTP